MPYFRILYPLLFGRNPCYNDFMQLTIDESNAKNLMREALIELMHERRDLFRDLMVEVLEDAGMIDAIQEGRRNEFVDETEIDALLVYGE